MEIDGRTVRYLDTGEGEPVVLVHCSSATHREWLPTIRQLGQGYRCLAPDLTAYGGSDPWPDGVAFNPMVDVNLVRRFIEEAGGPVHIVAHSYGAAAALEAARLTETPIRSITLIEPVAFHVLREAGRLAEWDEVRAVADAVRQCVERSDLPGGAGIYMSYWIGRLRWWLMPKRQKSSIVRTVTKVAHEFGMIGSTAVPLDAYRALTPSVRLVVGSNTPRSAWAVVEVLSKALPDAHVRVVKGAGHMSPFTHVDQVCALIVEQVRSVA